MHNLFYFNYLKIKQRCSAVQFSKGFKNPFIGKTCNFLNLEYERNVTTNDTPAVLFLLFAVRQQVVTSVFFFNTRFTCMHYADLKVCFSPWYTTTLLESEVFKNGLSTSQVLLFCSAQVSGEKHTQWS